MNIDLTEAVEAAAKAASELPAFVGNAKAYNGSTMWDSLRPEVQILLQEISLALVAAAAPYIVEQVKRELLINPESG